MQPPMTQLQIQTHLSPASALSHGVTEHGDLLVTPTAEELEALSAEQRDTLAKYVAPERAGDRFRHYSTLSVPRPGWAGVTEALEYQRAEEARTRQERQAEINNECAEYRQAIKLLCAGEYFEPGSMPPVSRKHNLRSGAPNYSKDDPEGQHLWAEFQRLSRDARTRLILAADAALGDDVDRHIVGDLEGWSPEVSALIDTKVWRDGKYAYDPEPRRALAVCAELNRRRQARSEALARANQTALRDLIGGHGTPDQLERFDAGVLPCAERSGLVRSVLFARMDLPLYCRITDEEVVDACDCDADDVVFNTYDHEGDLTADQWAALKAIRAQAPDGATITVRGHVGYARGHSSESDPEVRKLSVRVTVEFAGEKVRQEYALL